MKDVQEPGCTLPVTAFAKSNNPRACTSALRMAHAGNPHLPASCSLAIVSSAFCAPPTEPRADGPPVHRPAVRCAPGISARPASGAWAVPHPGATGCPAEAAVHLCVGAAAFHATCLQHPYPSASTRFPHLAPRRTTSARNHVTLCRAGLNGDRHHESLDRAVVSVGLRHSTRRKLWPIAATRCGPALSPSRPSASVATPKVLWGLH